MALLLYKTNNWYRRDNVLLQMRSRVLCKWSSDTPKNSPFGMIQKTYQRTYNIFTSLTTSTRSDRFGFFAVQLSFEDVDLLVRSCKIFRCLLNHRVRVPLQHQNIPEKNLHFKTFATNPPPPPIFLGGKLILSLTSIDMNIYIMCQTHKQIEESKVW